MVGEIIIWVFVCLIGVFVGGTVLSFFIATPIRFISAITTEIRDIRRYRIQSKCIHYLDKHNINHKGGLMDISSTLRIKPFRYVRQLSIDDLCKVYKYLYTKYDPQHREDVIDSVLKLL
jgi:hypothetical protein